MSASQSQSSIATSRDPQQNEQAAVVVSLDAALQNGLLMLRNLRQNVANTLEFINDGVVTSSSNANETTVDSEQIFLASSKKHLLKIYENYEQLETLGRGLPKNMSPNFLSVGVERLNQLLQEGQQSADFIHLYNNLLDVANSNETNSSLLHYLSEFQRTPQGRKRRSLMTVTSLPSPSFSSQQTLNINFEKSLYLATNNLHINRMMQISVLNKSRFSSTYQINVGNLLDIEKKWFSTKMKMLLFVSSGYPEMVLVKSVDEDWSYVDSKVNLLDESKYRVMRELTWQINCQLVQVFQRGRPVDARSLAMALFWMGAHGFIFDQPCKVCRRILNKSFLPPTCIDLRSCSGSLSRLPPLMHQSCR